MKRDKLAWNLFLVLLPAIISIIVFLLPTGWQEILVLKMDHLNPWSWLTYIFVHQNFQHLAGNVAVYIPASLLAYFALKKSDKNRTVWLIWLIVLIVPIITLALISLSKYLGIIPAQFGINSRGLSGISSAMIGLLGFGISRRIQRVWAKTDNFSVLLHACYYIFFPILAILTFQMSLLLSMLSFLAWLFLIFITIKSSKNNHKTKFHMHYPSKKEMAFIAICMMVSFLGAVNLMPKDIFYNGTTINSLAHLIGLAVGFWLPFFIISYQKLKSLLLQKQQKRKR